MGEKKDTDGKYQLLGLLSNYPYRSENYGLNFIEIRSSLVSYSAISASAISADGKYMIMADNDTGQVYVSSDRGVTWVMVMYLSPENSPLQTKCVAAMSADGRYQAVAYKGAVLKSTNYGDTWQDITNPNLTDTQVTAIAISSDGRYQLMATNGSFVYHSTDYGSSWQQIGYFGLSDLRSIAISADGKYIVAVENVSGSSGGVFRSTDYGVTWTKILGNASSYGVPYLSSTMSADGRYHTLLASSLSVSPSQIYRSVDYGVTWRLTSVPGITNLYNMERVAMSRSGKYQFIGTRSKRLLKSSNYGETWEYLDISNLNGTNILGFSTT